MSRTTLKLLVLAATVVALGAMASVARAGDGPVITTSGQPPWRPAPLTPHATISANGPTTSVSSNGNAYYYSPQGLCRRYVVGVSASPNSPFAITVGPTQQPVDIRVSAPLSQATWRSTPRACSRARTRGASTRALKGSWYRR